MKFLDEAKVFIRSARRKRLAWRFAAKNSSSSAAQRRNGRRGGDVIIEVVDGLNTLIDYRYQQHFKAPKAPWHGQDAMVPTASRSC